jgi:chorismate mutase
LELWIGALERINKAGVKKLAAIHRGFSNYEKTRYRNLPQWQIPIDLKTYIPEITLFSDPSHIGGDAKFIKELSQEALDLNFDGLMIETHAYPQKALSDAKQQITPERLKKILNELVIRNADAGNSGAFDEIEELRRKIDILDDHLIVTLEQRIRIVEKIGKLKRDNGITILQSDRWKKILNDATAKAKKKGLSQEFINKIFKLIHQEAISVQAKIMNKKHRK